MSNEKIANPDGSPGYTGKANTPDTTAAKVPNPGSPEAVKQCCKCAVMDNHYGKGFPWGDNPAAFWITQGCPLHAPEEAMTDAPKREECICKNVPHARREKGHVCTAACHLPGCPKPTAPPPENPATVGDPFGPVTNRLLAAALKVVDAAREWRRNYNQPNVRKKLHDALAAFDRQKEGDSGD